MKLLATAALFAVAFAADECIQNGSVCGADQVCQDPDPETDENWQCVCQLPATQIGEMEIAVCEYDECMYNDVCRKAGQVCSDPDKSKSNDFKCSCPTGYSGNPETGAAATCKPDKDLCDPDGAMCTAVGQSCEAPDLENYHCKCVPPATGTPVVGGVATCIYDECKEFGDAFCLKGSIPQTCSEASTSPNDIDWKCSCPSPYTSEGGDQRRATCKINECTTACDHCADKGDGKGNICEVNGQVCIERSDSVHKNWRCQCKGGSQGEAVMGLATCTEDECVVNEKVCTDAGQTCEDPSTSQKDDWICKCASGQTAVTKPAVCEYDECLDNEAICKAADQTCEDTDKSTMGTWICKCKDPATGTKKKGVAKCKLDECVVLCDHCEKDVCKDAKQKCKDRNTDVNSINDWVCICPDGKTENVGAPATCPVTEDECKDKNNKKVCTDKGQTCIDKIQDHLNNWECQCKFPDVGSNAVMAPADCKHDECATHGSTCENKGQTCEDPDDTVDNNWICKCKAPETGPNGNQAAADCKLNECDFDCPTCAKSGGHPDDVCKIAGQTCEDPNDSASSLKDWFCRCPKPMDTITNVGAPAECVLDECQVKCDHCADKDDGNGNVCTKAGQTCTDPVKTDASTKDWECKCPDPLTQKAVGQAANCPEDQCAMNTICSNAGQKCVQPDPFKSDWQCECIPPMTGHPGIGKVADCIEDECNAQNEKVCTDAGQTCSDPNTMQKNDWICECVAPHTGTAGQQQPATCMSTGDCLDAANVAVCTNAGQTCVDPDTSTPNDWTCVCLPGWTTVTAGNQNPAVCELDECTADCHTCNKNTCEDHGQTCFDNDKTTTNNWECRCVAPATGTKAVAYADCVLDECNTVCDHCASGPRDCAAANQDCVEGSTDANFKNDWVCKCRAPSTKQAQAAVVDSCTVDECSDPAKTCPAGQECHDPSSTTDNDWECRCLPPASGVMAGGPVPSCEVNECVATCATCAGTTCTDAGQDCFDPDHTVGSDWECRCKPPQTGTAGKLTAATDCILDECVAVCDTCARQGAIDVKNLCETAGQTCEDKNTSPTSTGDWWCTCATNANTKQIAIADCDVNECTDPTVNGQAVCGTQTCVDPDPTTMNDWKCECVAPAVGSKQMAQAFCNTNECTNNTVCSDAGQECVDGPEPLDWKCVCIAPGVGFANQMAVPDCDVDECQQYGNICLGASPPQTCVDPDKKVADNWECRCSAPATGSAVAKTADCMLDECTADCHSCAKTTCSDKDQECVDPVPTLASVSDWICKCKPPSTATAIAAAASCAVDECLITANNDACKNAGQTCRDDDHQKLDDWGCMCPDGQTGFAYGKPADCELDECVVKQAVCSLAGQVCFDPTKTADKLNDWECRCVPPTTGTPAKLEPATCKNVGDCEDPTKSSICTAAGQRCIDPSSKVVDDWQCACTPPSTGASVTNGPAICVLDECTASCPSCANGVCGTQECVDPNTLPSSINDWICKCPNGGGQAVAKKAICDVDECAVHGSTCTAAQQDCIDPDPREPMDWTCNCRTGSGSATAKPAVCDLDECVVNAPTCTTVGQTCVDENTAASSTNDWKCVCQPPATQSNYMGPATCEINECEKHGDLCRNAGQICQDDDLTAPDTWMCVCQPPLSSRKVMGVADCGLDECAVPSEKSAHICGRHFYRWTEEGCGCQCFWQEKFWGQADWTEKCWGGCCNNDGSKDSTGRVTDYCYVDPDPNGPNRNKPECLKLGQQDVRQFCVPLNQPPSDAVAAPKAPATHVCGEDNSGQTCNDPDKSVAGDWTCTCPDPTVGMSVAQQATCHLDECDASMPNLAICQAAGQECFDPVTTPDSTGDWRCICPPPQTVIGGGGINYAVAKAAQCEKDECHDNEDTCHKAGQVCVDPSHTTDSDWKCVCVPEEHGQQVGGKATCTPPAKSECPDNEAVCLAVGQACVDPDLTVIGDWECHCLTPAVGKQLRGPAVCPLDECVLTMDICSHCAGIPGPSTNNVCAQEGQTCVDPTPDDQNINDWKCVCAASGTYGEAIGKPAVCEIDECHLPGYQNPCEAVGQDCNDPNKDARNLGDWTCTCKSGMGVGQATGKPATCYYDECEFKGDSICGSDQVCGDRNTTYSSLDDWWCTCKGSSTGTAQGKPAVCQVDECEKKKGICVDAGQICEDPNQAGDSLNDWMCICPQDKNITQVAGAAKCLLDECKVIGCASCADKGGGNICALAGQTCEDPNTAIDKLNDWVCKCPTPHETTVGVTSVAHCPLDECVDFSGTGANNCQATRRFDTDGCICECDISVCAAGCCNPDGSAAEWCYLDTTVSYNRDTAVCKAKLDAANAQNRARGTCTPPTSAKPANAPGPNVIDNSSGYLPTDSPVNICTMAGQICVDNEKTTNSLNDWKCTCPPPSTGPEVHGGITACILDECKKNGHICYEEGQSCSDPNPYSNSTNDWICTCLAGDGQAVAQKATCTFKGDCDEITNSQVCTSKGQVCVDPDLQVTGDWLCECVPPATGTATQGRAASCQLNECTAVCPTCANSGFGNVCTQNEQTCVEGSTSFFETGDWKCVCMIGTGEKAIAPVDVCEIDECKDPSIKKVCTDAGQDCFDPDHKVKGDWQCKCNPGTGVASGKPAVCDIDECQDASKSQVCYEAGQLCVDPVHDGNSLNDWYCKCVNSDTTNVTNAAICVEPPKAWCILNSNICTDAGQLCEDAQPDVTKTGYCMCIPPQVGEHGLGKPAICNLNECNTTCPTCADKGSGNVCTQNEQTCIEGSTNPVTGLSDWVCKCMIGGNTQALGPATCTQNECDAGQPGTVCIGEEQLCTDPDPSTSKLGDWYCDCMPPSVGRKVAGVVEKCVYDECIDKEGICTAEGQTCFDPNDDFKSSGDWKCICPSPATGEAVAQPAVCSYTGDCDDKAISSICTNKGQTCFDPNTAQAGDWECRCVAPQTGNAGMQKAAECHIDECNVQCPTCAQKTGSMQHTCRMNEQLCVDPNTLVGSFNDWVCICPTNKAINATAAAAVCEVDECKDPAVAKVCEAQIGKDGDSVQMCVDDIKTSLNNWKCVCKSPYVGTPQTGAATTCEFDECFNSIDNSPVGVDVCGVNQQCLDPQLGADKFDNWICQCLDPSAGKPGLMSPATGCGPLGCDAQSAGTCEAAKQICVVADATWWCKCQEPAEGVMTKEGVATCIIDECVQNGKICIAAEGQTCVDPNTASDSLNDWMCVCNAPSKGQQVTGAAKCTIDECELTGKKVCNAAGQMCSDPNTDAQSLGDWTCTCTDPPGPSQVMGAAVCTVDECIEKAKTCSAAGQNCRDPNQSPSSLGDWICECPPPAEGFSVAGPADCKYKGECDIEANKLVCIQAEQACVDPDVGLDGDWQCVCREGRGEPGINKPAVCIVNECTDVCSHCAKKTDGAQDICAASGQTCYEPNEAATSTGDWMCRCPPPSADSNVAAPVESCQIDECRIRTETSAVGCDHRPRYTTDGCECACTWKMQWVGNAGPAREPGFKTSCTSGCCDPDFSGYDWCFLAASEWNTKQGSKCQSGTAQQCTGIAEPVPAGAPAIKYGSNICTDAGQICVDPDMSPGANGDWKCMCVDSEGEKLTAVATCTYDECKYNGSTCTDAGQTCEDPNKLSTSLNDWVCNCHDPAKGSAVAKAATCAYPSLPLCEEFGHICAEAGQYCNEFFANDWECICSEPSTAKNGNGIKEPAVCEIDECVVICPTCANTGSGNVCYDAGQLCTDPNVGSKSLSDWECSCPPPSGGSQVAAVALCSLDECIQLGSDGRTNSMVCIGGEQLCVDPNPYTNSTNDWICKCPMNDKFAVMTTAECLVNECDIEANAKVCTEAGQYCTDPFKSEVADNNWRCNCYAPSTGNATMKAAVCKEVGICVEKGHICSDVGQRCIPKTATEFECVCVAPLEGSAMMEPAVCGKDECSSICDTCQQKNSTAKKLCVVEEQACVDPDKTKDGDWYCECLAPQEGKGQPMSLATCTGKKCSDFNDEPLNCAELDGCFHNGAACTTKPPVVGCPRYNNDAVACDSQAECYHNSTACITVPPTTGCSKWDADVDACNQQAACMHNTTACIPVSSPPTDGGCSVWDNDEPTCNSQPTCLYRRNACVGRTWTPTLTLTLTYNDSWDIFNAADGGDDDDDCGWWCILLIILAILCCFLILAALWWRRRKNTPDADDEKWNKHFHAQVDENVEGDPLDNEDAPTTPYSEMADKEPIKDEDI
eukprot:TRINITY_DN58_c0_g1_i1.p1 TRINITY_DN58_c0_g1~~TRINITY_DN58_c0_g1_i1.p1  ORF type:complete len:4215 (+),score=1091.97 TRINITY_DN58_c0_g1_i1:148-12792(+)